MNFKRNCFSIITLLGSVFLITACGKNNDFEQYKYINGVTTSDKAEKAKDGSWEKQAQFNSYWARTKTTHGPEFRQELGTTYEVINNYTGSQILNAEGERKILVVPVDFADFESSINHDDYIRNVKKAFFGSAKNNKYVSVAEYYNRSSYGKLQIKGKVCDKFFTFHKNVTGEYAKELRREDVKDAYNMVIEATTGWYEANYHKSIDEFRLDPTDSTSPVAMYFVYAHPTDNANFFWAYTFEDVPLSWSSYETLDSSYDEPDAHTLIHEVGHMFGLKDYYPTEESDTVEPAGRIDMMDCSVGDHTGLSKMQLNWTRPYHILDSTEIKIKPLTSSGDLVLIQDNWNGTVFDDYFLIEMYVPLGLNYFDANIGNSKAKLPSLPGIKVYHIDSRLGYFTKQAMSTNLNFDGYCDVVGNGDPSATLNNIRIAHDNSTQQTVTEVVDYRTNYLYELELNNVGHPEAACATNINLFHKGDSFTIQPKTDSSKKAANTFYFNKELTDYDTTKSFYKYKITVKSLTYSGATLKIEKSN